MQPRQSRRLLPIRSEFVAAGLLAAASMALWAVVRNTSKAIREEIGELMDRVEAIVAVAEEEGRELTADEKAEVDGIMGAGKKGEADYKPGKIDKLEADALRVEKIEAKQAELVKRRGEGAPPQQGGGSTENREDHRPRAARIVIPVQQAYRHGSLKAYKGEHADQRAYIAGRFFLATIGKCQASQTWCREHGIDVQFMGAMKEGSNSLGGFLVPPEVEAAIIDLREQYGVFRREAYVTPMSGDTKTTPRRKSGLTAYFVGEGEEGTSSDKQWDQVELVAKKLMALCRVSNELNEDSVISMADDLTSEIAYAFAVKEDQCGFVGDGTSTYGKINGVVNAVAAGSVVTALAGNTSFETLDLVDFEACVGKLPEYPGINPKWYISKAGYAASMMRLIDAAGGNTTAQLEAGPSGREFLGYPVVITQVLNSTLGADTSKPKAVFGDLKLGATLGNRRGVSIMESEHRYFEYDQIGIKGSERFDINVHGRGTATAPGPLVVLKTPGA